MIFFYKKNIYLFLFNAEINKIDWFYKGYR